MHNCHASPDSDTGQCRVGPSEHAPALFESNEEVNVMHDRFIFKNSQIDNVTTYKGGRCKLWTEHM